MISTDPIDPAGLGQSGSQLAAQMGGSEADAAVGKAGPELLESISGGEVEVDIGLGVEHEPARRRLCLINSMERAIDQICRVGEEQRRVVAVDHQTWHLPPVEAIAHVVQSGVSWQIAQ